MPYTRPTEVPPQTPGMGAGARPVPFTQFLSDTWGTGSVVSAPAAGAYVARLATQAEGGPPAGTYATQLTYGFTGGTAETKDQNLVAMAGSTSITRLIHPTAVNTFLQTTLILSLDGLTEVTIRAVSGATASTVYAGQITAARIK